MDEYVFNDIKTVVAYLLNKLDNPTPLKLQKGLYFLWAFYSASYGSIPYDSDDHGEFEETDRYPKYLFPADFEAWKYGPVIKDVYHNFKEGKYQDIKNEFVPTTSNQKEVVLFMDDIIKQVNDVNDFGLVERSHQDSAWKDKFEKGKRNVLMDPEEIRKDDVGYFNEQSQI